MPAQAKKSANKTIYKNLRPALEAVETVQKVEKEAIKMGRDGVESLMRSADGFNHTANECMKICSGNISAIVESGSAASQIFKQVQHEIMESCNRVFSDYAEISKKALACRTLKDLSELQSEAMQQVSDGYFDTTNKLFRVVFNSCTEALEPISERTAAASEQIRKAMAV